MTDNHNNANVLLIPKIENGIVIDHIPSGYGVKILEIAHRHEELSTIIISLGMNYLSKRLGRKDLLKFQIKELPPSFLQHLSLICPGVTIKRIENFAVEKKIVLDVPELVDKVLKCPNPSCITNFEKSINTCFHLLEREPLTYGCNYCERHFSRAELEAALP
ncbi:MAG: aspartate carbamoyltransferase regulatory subunit [Candidatus Riflebacteria bacterium]|nr:aspartate carbamoyltransferase regulatory subunit [Candidatus Riflebacteria bacterium]